MVPGTLQEEVTQLNGTITFRRTGSDYTCQAEETVKGGRVLAAPCVTQDDLYVRDLGFEVVLGFEFEWGQSRHARRGALPVDGRAFSASSGAKTVTAATTFQRTSQAQQSVPDPTYTRGNQGHAHRKSSATLSQQI